MQNLAIFKRFKGMYPLAGATPLKRQRYLKRMAFVAAWVLLATSCVTERRVNEYLQKHPQPADTVIKEVKVYRDTTFYMTTPADTTRDSIFVVLPSKPQVGFKTDTLKSDTKFAKAMAWVVGEKLFLQVEIKSQQLKLFVDSIATLNTKTVTITKTNTVEKRFVPPFYKATLFISIILILIFIVAIFLYSRR